MATYVDVLLDPFGARWGDVLDGARQAVEGGYGGIWTWDHLAGSVHDDDRVLECWTVLTALAASVPGVTVGPLVLNVANRDAGTLAVMAATLQEVSGGRLVLGLGAGGGRFTPYASEQDALGRDVGSDAVRRRAVVEAVATLRAVWSGRLGVAAGFLRPDPPPPVVVGGFGPKMAELAGRVGDGINLPAGHPRLLELVADARRAFAAAGGDESRFLVTAFSGMERAWLNATSPARRRLAQAGVERLILLAHPPYRIPALIS